MTDLFDTSRVRDDAQYWDALAERVSARAVSASQASALEWLAHSRARWVAASLLLAAALLSIASPVAGTSATDGGAEWTRALAPADDVGKAIVLPDRPPSIGALLLKDRGGT